jgi:regulator of protease activity HflC (stomatin/prohibitin superfamily)
MAALQELMNSAAGGSKGMMGAAGAAIAVAGTGIKAFTKIEEGERGVRSHYGRTHRNRDAWFSDKREGDLFGIVGPGMHFMVPFTHSIRKVNVKDRGNDLDNITVTSDEDKQFIISPYIRWHVREDGDHPYRASYKVNGEGELVQNVVQACTSGLNEVITEANRVDLYNFGQIDHDVQDACYEELLYYGVALKKLGIKEIRESDVDRLGRMIGKHNVSLLGQIAASEMVDPPIMQPAGADKESTGLHIISR